MDIKIEANWKERLHDVFEKPNFNNLTNFVRTEYAMQKIYLPGNLIFNAFAKCPFDKVKVVILGFKEYSGRFIGPFPGTPAK